MKKNFIVAFLLIAFVALAQAKNYYAAVIVVDDATSKATYTNINTFDSENAKEAYSLASNAAQDLSNEKTSTYVFVNENQKIVESLLNKKVADLKTKLGANNVQKSANVNVE
ncbi:MAG: hypothetical protein IPK18_10510 [Sphingobacteriales bacterium]|jgi:hypothetical protein|nr:MAG: hypothetical protein IPK18_10510 [Sphingobacteriales bacterium]